VNSQPVEALEVVEADLRSAQDYYASWRSDGASYLKAQFDEAVKWIEWNPELFPKRFRFFRRAVMRNTFFGIFYVIEPGVTTIVAVLDMRQRPRELRNLVTGRGPPRSSI
jgi:ParE toxin of type II toxin-antitoxin system, parDE